MKVSREEMTHSLRAVKPGLSNRPGVEQADCVYFRKGRAHTFNDHVYCKAWTPLDDSVRGVFLATKLSEILDRVPDEVLDVSQRGSSLLFKAPGRVCRATAVAEEPSHLDLIDRVRDWGELDGEFVDAAGLVSECASALDHLVTSFVHVHPEYLEAFDNRQLMRYEVPTPVAESVFLKRNAVRHLTDLGCTEVCQTDHWVHFRNKDGNVIGARKYAESFPDLEAAFKTKGGKRLPLPDGLSDAVKTCAVACPPEAKDRPQFVLVRLTPGRIDVVGDSPGLSHRESREAEWEGPEVYFFAFPGVLQSLCRMTTECVLTGNSLVIEGGRWRYAAVLGEVESLGDRYTELLGA